MSSICVCNILGWNIHCHSLLPKSPTHFSTSFFSMGLQLMNKACMEWTSYIYINMCALCSTAISSLSYSDSASLHHRNPGIESYPNAHNNQETLTQNNWNWYYIVDRVHYPYNVFTCALGIIIITFGSVVGIMPLAFQVEVPSMAYANFFNHNRCLLCKNILISYSRKYNKCLWPLAA